MLNYKLLVFQKWATNRANLGGGENQTFTIGRTKKSKTDVQRNKTIIIFAPDNNNKVYVSEY